MEKTNNMSDKTVLPKEEYKERSNRVDEWLQNPNTQNKNKKDRIIITILLILITIQTIILFGYLLLPYGYK